MGTIKAPLCGIDVIEKADVSYSSFQKIFRVKDSALNELVEFMFSSQFN